MNDAAKQADLDAKAALVAQAEAANSAAIDSDPAPKKAPEPPKAAAQAPASSPTPSPPASPEEKGKQKAEQYKADKKSALDQGYTEEQAELYAQQEAAQ